MKKSILLFMLLALMLMLHGCTITDQALNQKAGLVSSKVEAINFFLQAEENWNVVRTDVTGVTGNKSTNRFTVYYDSSSKKYYRETYGLNEDNEEIVTDYVFCSNDVQYQYANNRGYDLYYTDQGDYGGVDFYRQSFNMLSFIKQQLDKVTYTKNGTNIILNFTVPLGEIYVDMTFEYKGDSKIYINYHGIGKEVVYEVSDNSLDDIFDSISFHFDDEVNNNIEAYELMKSVFHSFTQKTQLCIGYIPDAENSYTLYNDLDNKRAFLYETEGDVQSETYFLDNVGYIYTLQDGIKNYSTSPGLSPDLMENVFSLVDGYLETVSVESYEVLNYQVTLFLTDGVKVIIGSDEIRIVKNNGFKVTIYDYDLDSFFDHMDFDFSLYPQQ